MRTRVRPGAEQFPGTTPSTAWARRAGATQVEAALGLGCTGLLFAILAAAAGELRSDARLDKCLANLRQIGTAMSMYFQDEGDWFPHGPSNAKKPDGIYYGGHPGVQDPNEPDRNWIYTGPEPRTTPNGRPFNRYLYPGLPGHDFRPTDPRFEAVRSLPIFYCPADTGRKRDPNVPWQDPNDADPNESMYYRWGTSYDSMYHWPQAWAINYRRGVDSKDTRWLHISNAFSRVQLRYYAAISVIIYEDSFDTAQWYKVPRRGWHGELNTHNMLFMDSHAAAITADTTKALVGHRGPGWKTNSGGDGRWTGGVWWVERFDPDYRYRLIPAIDR